MLAKPLALADAQLVIAREYSFSHWSALKRRVEVSGDIERLKPHPGFPAALAALDAGDLDRLRALIAADPSLLHARTNLDPRYGYFAGATLLHHVAGNPYRDNPLPRNIVQVARVLLEAGADANALTLGPNGGDTMGLLVCSTWPTCAARSALPRCSSGTAPHARVRRRSRPHIRLSRNTCASMRVGSAWEVCPQADF